MSFEVDIRAVGEGSKSGDAIALRFGDLSSIRTQYVVVIDGGFAGGAKEFISFLDGYYGTRTVDLMIATHPDGDHTGGLVTLIDELEVGELWMHRPWEYEADVSSYVMKGTSTRTFTEPMKRALSTAWELEKAAKRRGIPITEPFRDLTWGDGALRVLGPSQAYYSSLVENFGTSALDALAAKVRGALTKAKERVVDLWDEEALVEPAPDAVSHRNNSSVVLHASFEGTSVLFTADAGVPALTRAMDARDAAGLGKTTFGQLPHHGSKRNVGPTIMTRMLGDPVPEGEFSRREAFISAAKQGAPKHPSQRVLNAANRRGVRPCVTSGRDMMLSSPDRAREGWTPMTPEPFVSVYEEE